MKKILTTTLVTAMVLSIGAAGVFAANGAGKNAAANSTGKGKFNITSGQNKSASADKSTHDDHHATDRQITVSPLSEAQKQASSAGYGAAGALADTNLSIVDMLQYAVEDEYLAHGEYVAIMDKFGVQKPYTNIMKAEEQHLAELKLIYDAYGMSFPEDKSASHLVVPQTLTEAAQTGVKAEEDNIAMYEKFLAQPNLPQAVIDVFTALKDASVKHQTAFERQLSK